MDTLTGFGSFVVGNIVSVGVGALSAFAIGVVLNFVWDYFKPVRFDVVAHAKEKAFRTGANTAAFIRTRVPDKGLQEKMISELADGSEEIQDEFVLGLKSLNV